MSDPTLLSEVLNSNVCGAVSVAILGLRNLVSLEIVYFQPRSSFFASYVPDPGVSLQIQSYTCSFEITYPYVFSLKEYIGLVLLLLGVYSHPIVDYTSYSPGPVSLL